MFFLFLYILLFFCTSCCFLCTSFLHILLFCTFFIFYFIAHFTLISPFLTICMPLCYVTLYNLYSYYFALSTERTWFDYISLLIIPCITIMWQIKKPWTLNLELITDYHLLDYASRNKSLVHNSRELYGNVMVKFRKGEHLSLEFPVNWELCRLVSVYLCVVGWERLCEITGGVVPSSDPCQIITLLVLVGLGLGVGEGLELGVGLGLGNQIAISTGGVIIWQGVENGTHCPSSLHLS